MFTNVEAFVHISGAMVVLYTMLAAASLSVAVLTRHAAPGMLASQINAWWRIFPVISVVLLTYPLGPALFACLVFLLAILELAAHYPGGRREFWAGAAFIFVSTAFLHYKTSDAAAAILLSAITLQALLFWRCPHKRSLVWLLVLLAAGAMLILAAFAALPFTPKVILAWLFYLFIVTALNDIGQFVVGKLFGRDRLARRISPNKTWQGAFGGLGVSLLVSQILGTHLALANTPRLAAYAVLLSCGGLAGDLMFSAAKRYLLIKDFSQLIPGHGGILDRVDSLIVTAPLLYCLLRISA